MTPRPTMRRDLVVGLTGAIAGWALYWTALVGMVAFYRLGKGDTAPLSVTIVPACVLAVWTAVVLRGSARRQWISLVAWLVAIAVVFRPTPWRAPWTPDKDMVVLIVAVAVAHAFAWLVMLVCARLRD